MSGQLASEGPDIPFESRIFRKLPPDLRQGTPILVAVSGGPDSVALLRILATARSGISRPSVAHFDHRLRPESSEEARFVAQLADHLGLPMHMGRWDHGGRPSDGASQDAARRVRYDYLVQLAEKIGARYVATGHTADDQAETILHHIVRGTGLRGLGGMRPVRVLSPAVTLIRPLLSVTRVELEHYLERLQQPYRTDPSNLQGDYTRSRLRHRLLPMLRKEFNPEISGALMRLGAMARAIQGELQSHAEAALEHSAPVIRRDHIEFRCAACKEASEVHLREQLAISWRRAGFPERAMGFREWKLLTKMARGAGPRQHIFPGRIRAVRQDGTLSVTREYRADAE